MVLTDLEKAHNIDLYNGDNRPKSIRTNFVLKFNEKDSRLTQKAYETLSELAVGETYYDNNYTFYLYYNDEETMTKAMMKI